MSSSESVRVLGVPIEVVEEAPGFTSYEGKGGPWWVRVDFSTELVLIRIHERTAAGVWKSRSEQVLAASASLEDVSEAARGAMRALIREAA